ncbi:MAG: hypothetical protein LBG27_01885 [Spirochaetaceae bacterium]|jgi:hypothetical protein|nr:hypothetical protein [Spirochaetaceae bacterium]
MNISLLFNVFLGETSPLIAARIDSQAYEMGARRVENLIPMLTGGIRKRPGTWYNGTTKNNNAARLIEWLLPNGNCVILEFTTGTIRVWQQNESEGYPYQVIQELSNPYETEEEIRDIKYAASANSLWVVHPAHQPLKLTWEGDQAVISFPDFTGKDFTTEGNHPGSAAFDAGRLCFAGTINEPNRIFMSKAPDSQTGEDRYTDFTAGDNPADAIVLEENDMHGSRLQWIAANRRLLAATERATWSDTGDIPTPSTFDMNIIEYAGANGLQARGTKEMMVYAGRSGKTLRALVWTNSDSGEGFIDMDISEQAAHLFSSGIKDFAVADYPYPVIWIVTKAGALISCTANIKSGFLAYARHPTDGLVEAVAVSPERDGDVVFLEVKRGDSRNIEHLILEDLVNADFADSHYIDAGESRTFNPPTKIITGLERFAGKTIRAFVDGAAEPPVRVDDTGVAEFQVNVSKVHLGLPYKAVFSPNTRQIPANGTSLGKKRRIEKVMIQFYKSLGGRVGTTEEKSEEIITQRFGSYVLGSAPEPFTGEIDITVSGNIDPEGKIIITQDEPVPFTILALVERIAVLEA